MNIFRRGVRRGYREFAAWSRRGGKFRRRLYYRVFSQGFVREQDAVGAGVAAYYAQRASGDDLYLLRRNVHMMEKGLTMQPRRPLFATRYNRQTVAAFSEAVERRKATPWLESEEFMWMTSVLSEYFEATRSSGDAQIANLEAQFLAALSEASVGDFNHGPLAPAIDQSPVCIDDLIMLAERRRSVRWFRNQKVDRSIVDQAMRVAMEAPTACNRQPYRFEVFDSPGDVAKVSSVPMGTAGYSHQIPGVIVVIGDLSAFFDERDRHLIYIDGSMAVMGLLMGLEAQGVASCAINWPDMPEKEKAIKRLLGLANHERVVMLVAFGYSHPEGLAPFSGKRSLDEVRSYSQLP